MKALTSLILILSVTTLVGCNSRPTEQTHPGNSATDSTYAQYRMHREEVLKMAPEDLGLIGQPNRTLAYGFVVDIPHSMDMVTTLFAYSNGDAGYYDDDGRYFLSEGDSLVGVQAKRVIEETIRRREQFSRTDSMDLPDYMHYQFYLLTNEGRFRVRYKKKTDFNHSFEEIQDSMPSLSALDSVIQALGEKRAIEQAHADSVSDSLSRYFDHEPESTH